ncbi:glutamate--cysteine ligase [Williamsia sp. CHRR-6]|uniref:glutamate--cysteine ligase n=1 Tax=Williamsia sp. CHRR-6 TaxID=2835871 RepID=UPI001BDAC84E|nr:glutamate--cysteine ligase [Williamsia sp. CHRR-6]MBT0567027.1 glutamate--cysteine ligase [Williamsia sp. CHRR-6]
MTPSIGFDGSPTPSLGVEWEFALVDKTTGALRNCAAELFERVVAREDPDLTRRVHRELLRNTVEVVTGVCTTVGEAVDDLRHTLAVVRPMAEAIGVDLYGAATHPYGEWSTAQLTEGPRYAELIERTQWWGRQMLIWGVHVHVGISKRDKVLPVMNALLAYYPHLLALSASSPMWGGQDTGYASNRAMMFQQLPTAGLPFQFSQWADFEGFVADQKMTGIIDHMNEIRWDIRPSPHLGTIEVRVCDGVSTVAELQALVALIHCLVVDLDDHFTAGTLPRELAPWLVQENKWRAARYGLDAVIITDADCAERLVTDDLADLLDRLAPVARRLACVDELASVARIVEGRASYQRQREVFSRTGDMRDVVSAVVAELDC